MNKAAKTLIRERFIPGGFPMCSLFYFFHMFTLVKHIIQRGTPLFSGLSRGRLGLLLSQKYTGDIPQRSFMKLPKTDLSKRRCEETSVQRPDVEKVKLQDASAGNSASVALAEM